jgi:hypothetical protein
MHTHDSDVLYERSDGELKAVPDELSRDIMEKDIELCHRFQEAVDAVTKDGSRTEKKRDAKNMRASLGKRTL